ncbi:MAG: preprotein translocase subunit SecG [Paramuribaculum sp.]|nr:preprotein translocase subunit SecG [Paramuribaculum sp.]
MFALLVVLTLIAAVLLIGVVLIQKSKGGGLSSTFAGSNQLMGVRRTNNFIEKATWWLAGAICVFAILSTFFMPNAISRTGARVTGTPQTEQVAGGNYDTELPSGVQETQQPEATLPQPTEAAPAQTPQD